MTGGWELVLSRSRANALRFLALSRVDASRNLFGLESHLNRLKALTPEKLASLWSSSGFHGWLAIVEAQFTSEHSWFSHEFSHWIGLEPEALHAFLIEYLDLRICCLESNARPLTINTRFHQGAFEKLELSPKLAVTEWLEVSLGDPFLLANFTGLETLQRENDTDLMQHFALSVRSALDLIGAWCPETLHKVQMLVREVVPCRSPAPPAFPSGSCTATPSAVYLTVTNEVEAIAEMLIHETSHIHLACVDESNPLVLGLTRQEAWDVESWYSPWRDQPRSLMGILHAIHVFSNVLDYHRHRVETSASSVGFNASRLSTLHAQLRYARRLNPLDSKLSDAGQSVLRHSDALLQKCGDLAIKLERDGVKVRFAERHRLWQPDSDRVEDAVVDHCAWFAQQYQEVMR